MAVKFLFHDAYTQDRSLELQANILTTFMRTLDRLSHFAEPKNFVFLGATLIEAQQIPSDESRHTVRNIWPVDTPVDEVIRIQVHGRIGNRTVNVVARYTFHTYLNNRSGSEEFRINGKDAWLREDLGGLELEDIWQDNNKWMKEAGVKEAIDNG